MCCNLAASQLYRKAPDLSDRQIRGFLRCMSCQTIVERTQTGRAIALQDPNYREGRPKKYSGSQLAHAMELLEEGRTYRQVEELTGISKSTLIRARRN